MLIGKNWKIEADTLDVILSQRRVNKKAGKEYWEVIGYYSTVANALKDLVNFRVRETALKDLQTIVAKIDELGRQIEKATRR